MMVLLRKIIFSLICLSFLFLLVVPISLYCYGLSHTKGQLDAPQQSFEKNTLDSYKTWLGETNGSKYRKLNVYSFIFTVIAQQKSRLAKGELRSADIQLYSLASSSLLRALSQVKRVKAWHLSNASAFIFVSRNWTVDQSISQILKSSYFGHGTYGLNKAANLYFGGSATNLTENQLFALFHLTTAPSRFDLWCFPARHEKTITALLKRRGVVHDMSELNLLPKPVNACDSFNK